MHVDRSRLVHHWYIISCTICTTQRWVAFRVTALFSVCERLLRRSPLEMVQRVQQGVRKEIMCRKDLMLAARIHQARFRRHNGFGSVP
jgi:hypothetical protein